MAKHNVNAKWTNGDLVFANDAGTTIAKFSNTGASLSRKRPVQLSSAAGATTITEGVVLISGVAHAVTLADPTTGDDDGKVLHFRSETAQTHTINNSAGSGFNSAGASKDIATLGGAIGDGISVVAYLGKWWVLKSINATQG